MRANLIASLSRPYRALMYSLTPFVPSSVRAVGNNGQLWSASIIRKYSAYPVICDLVEL